MNLQNITPVVQTALCIIPPEEMWDPIQVLSFFIIITLI